MRAVCWRRLTLRKFSIICPFFSGLTAINSPRFLLLVSGSAAKTTNSGE